MDGQITIFEWMPDACPMTLGQKMRSMGYKNTYEEHPNHECDVEMVDVHEYPKLHKVKCHYTGSAYYVGSYGWPLKWWKEIEPMVCKFSNHTCNKENLWEVADTLDDIKCKHICCRKCDVKGCGARCNGSEEPHKSLRAEYDLPVPKDTKWDMRGYCDTWHYVDEELPEEGDVFWTYAVSGTVPLFGYSAYFKDKWWRWREWEHKWDSELGRVKIIAYMQIPSIQRSKDVELKEMLGLNGIIEEVKK